MPRPDPADVPHSRPSREGVLYCFTHPEMPGLCKVGATRKDPVVRATELSGGTGVPGAFRVAYWRSFPDCFVAEVAAHEAFADRRVDEQREFFRVEVSNVAAFARELADRLSVPSGREGGEWLDSEDAKAGFAAETARLFPFATLFARLNEDPNAPGELTEEERQQVAALRTARLLPQETIS